MKNVAVAIVIIVFYHCCCRCCCCCCCCCNNWDYVVSLATYTYDNCFILNARENLTSPCLFQVGVEDDRFWEDLDYLEFGDIPKLEQDVVVVGFATGGDNISVTRGVVSRVDIRRYSHSGQDLLVIQVRLDLVRLTITNHKSSIIPGVSKKFPPFD